MVRGLTHHGWTLVGAFSLVVILAIIALYIADPNGVGETAFATAALGCVVALSLIHI